MRPRQGKASILNYRGQSGVPTTVMIPSHYKKMLQFLSNKTRIRQSEYLREALQDLLIKYRREFDRSPFEF